MLKSEDIINGLQAIVNEYTGVAITWHVLFYCLIAAFAFKWEPSTRSFALILALPLLSVAFLAWKTGNPFNGTIFAITAALLFIFGFKISSSTVNYSQLPFVVAGILMVTFGLIYPHFFTPDSFLKYLYASPAGLIPCPTLSVIIGFLLIYNGLNSAAITMTLIVLGLFYGIFGVLKLGVYLDLVLVAGTVSLLIRFLLSFGKV